MYRSLLVPLDGSPFAEQALPFALTIVRRAAASLQVVAVMPHPGILVSTQFVAHMLGRWSGYLERVVERIQRCHAVPVSCRVLEGEAVAPTIAAYVKQIEADLVVMTTHGRGTLGRLWFGSVAYELIRNLSVPALFVRPHDGVAEWDTEPALRHMLIALDGSLLAERMLEPAVTLGTLMNADYVLLRVLNDVPVGAPELDPISLSSPALELLDEIQAVQERLRKEAQDYLDRAAELAAIPRTVRPDPGDRRRRSCDWNPGCGCGAGRRPCRLGDTWLYRSFGAGAGARLAQGHPRRDEADLGPIACGNEARRPLRGCLQIRKTATRSQALPGTAPPRGSASPSEMPQKQGMSLQRGRSGASRQCGPKQSLGPRARGIMR